jgi:hypothetical protein
MAITDTAFRSSLTKEVVEHAYGKCSRARDDRNQGFADTGFRAAKARDPKLLVALEEMAKVTLQMQEGQMGRVMRSPDATFGESKGTTEHQLCREAYRLADEGSPIRNFEWIYGAAAYLCGYNF